MRIVHFHQNFSNTGGATATTSYERARRLVKRGHEVTIICGSLGEGSTGLEGPFRKGRREGMVAGMRVIEFELPYSNKLSFINRTIIFLRYAIRSIGIALTLKMDCVLVTSPPLTGALPGIAARYLKGVPFVLEVYDLWPDYPKQMGVIKNPVILVLISWLEWISYHSAHKLVGTAPGIKAGIARRGIPDDRISMIQHGSDLDLFEYRPIKAPLPFAIDGVAESDFIALYAGTHGIANGIDAILDAAAEVKRRGRGDIKFILAGEGMRKPQLQERGRAEDLPVFFLDPMPKVQLVKLLTAADVGLVVLSDFPLFYNSAAPTKFTDYIAAGLPVMMNYPGWLGEKLDASNSGLVVPPGDAVAFADGLVALADDPARARAMGANARALAESDFDRDTLTERFATLIEGLQR